MICPSVKVPLKVYVPAEVMVAIPPSILTPSAFAEREVPFKTICPGSVLAQGNPAVSSQE